MQSQEHVASLCVDLDHVNKAEAVNLGLKCEQERHIAHHLLHCRVVRDEGSTLPVSVVERLLKIAI